MPRIHKVIVLVNEIAITALSLSSFKLAAPEYDIPLLTFDIISLTTLDIVPLYLTVELTPSIEE